MNKTKMIATIGPSSKSKDVIKQMILNGVDVIRINMSHSNFEEAKDIILKVRELNRELNIITGIMIDTKGPEIRVCDLEKTKIKLNKDSKVRIMKNIIKGNEEMFSISMPSIFEYIRVGQTIMLNDGGVELEVISKNDEMIVCEVKNDGYIKSNCSLNIPGVEFNFNFLSDFDKETIKFAVIMQVDYLALSHVKNDLDVLDVNDELIKLDDGHIQLISKIENKSAIDEIDSILKVSDGVMVARGDLGVEMDLEKIPSIQKKISNLAKENEKICVIATEMLSSMQENLRPTRAEVSDVANAILDGTDAIMLSSETAIGKYPKETVLTANKIIDETEKEINYNNLLLEFNRKEKIDITDAICYCVVDSSNRVDAKTIICSTISGKTAKKISHFRPMSSIIAISPDERTVSGLTINYGIIPIKVPMLDTTDEIVDMSIKVATKILNLNVKDKVVIAGSFPNKEVDYTNFMKIEEIK